MGNFQTWNKIAGLIWTNVYEIELHLLSSLVCGDWPSLGVWLGSCDCCSIHILEILRFNIIVWMLKAVLGQLLEVEPPRCQSPAEKLIDQMSDVLQTPDYEIFRSSSECFLLYLKISYIYSYEIHVALFRVMTQSIEWAWFNATKSKFT